MFLDFLTLASISAFILKISYKIFNFQMLFKKKKANLLFSHCIFFFFSVLEEELHLSERLVCCVDFLFHCLLSLF